MNKMLLLDKIATSGKCLVIAGIFAVGTLAVSQQSATRCCAAAPDSNASAVKVEKAVTTQKLPRLVDLGAKKCIPCKKMAPILEELTSEYAGIMMVEFIDVWEQENVPKAKKYGIESIPTQIFLDADGKELWRHQGYISKADLLAKWKSLGYDMEKMKKDKQAAKDAK